MVWGGKTMDFAIRLLEIRKNAILLFIFPFVFSIFWKDPEVNVDT